MYLDMVTTILIVITPALSGVLTILGCVLKIISTTKKAQKQTADDLEKKTSKMEKSFNDIAIIKSKLTSIETYLLEEKEKKGGGRK